MRQHLLTSWKAVVPDVGKQQSDILTQTLRELCLKSEEEEPNRSSVTGSLLLFVCERHYFTVPLKARECRIFRNKAGLRMRTTRRTNRVILILIPDSTFTLGTLHGARVASCERCRAED